MEVDASLTQRTPPPAGALIGGAFVLFWATVGVWHLGQKWPKSMRVTLGTFGMAATTAAGVAGVALSGPKEEEDERERYRPMKKVAKGLEDRSLETLNLLIKHAPVEGDPALLGDELTDEEINRLHDDLCRLDRALQRACRSDDADTTYDDSLYIGIEDEGSTAWIQFNGALKDPEYEGRVRVGGKSISCTPDQYERLVWGYCLSRDDLISGLYLKEVENYHRFGKNKFQIFPKHLAVPQQFKMWGNTYDVEADKLKYAKPLPAKAGGLDLATVENLNHYIVAGGGEAVGGASDEELGRLFGVMKDFDAALGEQRDFENDYLKLDRDLHLELKDKPADVSLTQEQLHALFLGQVAKTRAYMGATEEGNGRYLLWRRQQPVRVTGVMSLIGIADSLTKELQPAIDALAGRQGGESTLFDLEKDGDDLIITLKRFDLGGQGYMRAGDKLLIFPEDKVKDTLDGVMRYGKLPGVKEIKEIKPGLKYRLVKA